MRKKWYRGKACAYCARPGVSETQDHVISREFFLEHRRGNLPKVPACLDCNNTKSKLELYLTAVMPFGAAHPEATATLETLVPGRMRGNQKLSRGLAEGIQQTDKGMTLPLDSEKVTELYEWIAKGLAHLHWETLLPADGYFVSAGFVIGAVEPTFDQMFRLGTVQRVGASLGAGVFTYEGVRDTAIPGFTAWRMSLYGAAMRDDANPGETPRVGYVLTGPWTLATVLPLAQQLRGDSKRGPLVPPSYV
jgi:hypothetical protein